MHFLSDEFLLFALVFVAIFFWLPLPGQKVLLVVASFIFCSSQDFLFGALLGASIAVNYVASQLMSREGWVSRAMWSGIWLNLVLLGIFKYFNFFSSSVVIGLNAAGLHFSPITLDLAMPLGLSFYTMQAISFLVDLRDDKIRRPSLLDLAVYLSFWPKFVAGPIVRATRFLPQLERVRRFRWANFYLGLEFIIYGLLLKTLLSDYIAPQVNRIYAAPDAFDGAATLTAVVFFTFQIYGDFAGYSLVVIGLARILGFSIAPNFKRPNFATSMSDFWSRWHISLSSWLEDYIFRRLIPKPRSTEGHWLSVSDVYREFLGASAVASGDTFVSLGGDSLAFVQVAMALEQTIGSLPDGWERMSIGHLEGLGGTLASA